MDDASRPLFARAIEIEKPVPVSCSGRKRNSRSSLLPDLLFWLASKPDYPVRISLRAAV
jgi:hypothetical protein